MKMVRALIPFLLALALHAGEYVVAVSPSSSIERLSAHTVASLYLDKRRSLGGYRVVLLNLPLDNAIRRSFEKRVLKITRRELERYWLRAHFRGHQPPKVLKSQEAVARFIEKIPHAIGYMERSVAKKHGLKIVLTWSP
ncbi:hypothetical protein [Hydrogenimonas sp.]